MTMQFRTIKDAIVSILGAAEAGRFTTIGYQKQAQCVQTLKDSGRTVQIFYSSGDFDKRGGSLNGPCSHDVTFEIQMLAASAATGDLSTLENPSATEAQIATALSNFGNATSLADDSLDELFDVVYQIIMNASNIDFGLAIGNVADRFITSFKKGAPNKYGQVVVLPGTATLTCKVSESVTGDTPTAMTGGVDVEIGNPDSDYEMGTET